MPCPHARLHHVPQDGSGGVKHPPNVQLSSSSSPPLPPFTRAHRDQQPAIASSLPLLFGLPLPSPLPSLGPSLQAAALFCPPPPISPLPPPRHTSLPPSYEGTVKHVVPTINGTTQTHQTLPPFDVVLGAQGSESIWWDSLIGDLPPDPEMWFDNELGIGAHNAEGSQAGADSGDCDSINIYSDMDVDHANAADGGESGRRGGDNGFTDMLVDGAE